MNELALFAGAGGGILGGSLLGWNTVCACEIEKYPRNVLLARQRDGLLPHFPIWDDVTTFNGTPWRGMVDVITGGFPCQDISCAGKGAGITGSRSGLWSHMHRIICEVRPPSRSWKIAHSLPLGDLVQFSETWPKQGIMLHGVAYRLKNAELPTSVSESGFSQQTLIPTTTCRGLDGGSHSRAKLRKMATQRETFPTPMAHNAKELTPCPSTLNRRTPGLGSLAAHGQLGHAGKLNPTWVEWLMGWPLGWTDLEPLETDKYRSWLQLHSAALPTL